MLHFAISINQHPFAFKLSVTLVISIELTQTQLELIFATLIYEAMYLNWPIMALLVAQVVNDSLSYLL